MDDIAPHRVLFDWDYGYGLPLRSQIDVVSLLSPALVDDLRAWLDVFETANPSRDNELPSSWMSEGRALRERVSNELGPEFEVVWGPDRRRP